RELGLSLQDAEHRADVYLRIPQYDASLFRGAVERDGLPVADILQVWLDVSNFPARGRAQADEKSTSKTSANAWSRTDSGKNSSATINRRQRITVSGMLNQGFMRSF